MATQKFVNEAGLRRYTAKTKKAIAEAAKTVEQNKISDNENSNLQLVLAHEDKSTISNKQVDNVNVSSKIYFNPSKSELSITDGVSKTITITPKGVSGDGVSIPEADLAYDYNGTVTVTANAGTSSNAPTVKVKVGQTEATSGQLSKATTGIYGVTKLSDSTGTSTTLAATQNLATKSAKTVRLNQESGNKELPILMSHNNTITSGSNYEGGYNNNFTINPNGSLTVKDDSSHVIINSNGNIQLKSADGQLSVTGYDIVFPNANTINGTTYEGKATGTETDLANKTSGATMVGYTNTATGYTNTTVKDALDKLITDVNNISLDGNSVTVGVAGTNATFTANSPLDTVVTALDTAIGTKQDTLVSGTNIKTVDGQSIVGSGNIDTKYVDQSPISADGTYPVLLAGFDVSNASQTTTKTGTSANFDESGLNFNPKSNTLDTGIVVASNKLVVGDTSNKIGGVNKYSNINTIQITGGTITFNDYAVGSTDGTITKDQYSGNAATATKATTADTATKATQDKDGNQIDTTYAKQANTYTKSETYTQTEVNNLISNLSKSQFVIPDNNTLPTLGTTAAANNEYFGKIYLIKDQEYGQTNDNIYQEYIMVEGKDGTYKWELLGTTDAGVDVVSLTNDEIDAIWNDTAAAV